MTLGRTLHIMGVIGGVFLGLLSSGCQKGDSEGEAASATTTVEKPVLVELAAIERGLIEEILERSSALEAEAQVQVLARTQNPAVELFVEEGDRVVQDQVLLRLENDRQKTDYSQAESQLSKVRIDFERQESLYNQSLISEADYRNARFQFDQAVLAADTAKRELEYTEVRAPIGGTVTSRTVKVGDSVTTGAPIFEIIDLDSTVAIIHVPEQYLPKLKPDMDARLISSTFGDKVYPGYVKRISPIVDPQAGTIKVVVGVRELGELRPGIWVDVELVLNTKTDALLIPKPAIVYDNDQSFAFVAYTDENNVRRARRVRVDAVNEDKAHIEPAEGFSEGDLIVVAGQSGLKEDAAIRELGEEVPPQETTAAPQKPKGSAKPKG